MASFAHRRKITLAPCSDYTLLNLLDSATFLLDERPVFENAQWYIGRDGDEPACFCAWKTVCHDFPQGFHYRAGVLPSYRGRGLQQRMLELREYKMRMAGLVKAVSYTDADNAASMRSLIACGYLPYAPTELTCLSGGLARKGRVGFVHWNKLLTR